MNDRFCAFALSVAVVCAAITWGWAPNLAPQHPADGCPCKDGKCPCGPKCPSPCPNCPTPSPEPDNEDDFPLIGCWRPGDILHRIFHPPVKPTPPPAVRIHGPFLTRPEAERCACEWRRRGFAAVVKVHPRGWVVHVYG